MTWFSKPEPEDSMDFLDYFIPKPEMIDECRARLADPSYTQYDLENAALAIQDLHQADNLLRQLEEQLTDKDERLACAAKVLESWDRLFVHEGVCQYSPLTNQYTHRGDCVEDTGCARQAQKGALIS